MNHHRRSTTHLLESSSLYRSKPSVLHLCRPIGFQTVFYCIEQPLLWSVSGNPYGLYSSRPFRHVKIFSLCSTVAIPYYRGPESIVNANFRFFDFSIINLQSLSHIMMTYCTVYSLLARIVVGTNLSLYFYCGKKNIFFLFVARCDC